MRIVRAEAFGMCFGVRDAITLAEAAGRSEPLTVLGELVHNPVVNARLAARGLERRSSIASALEHPEGLQRVLITAHGASHADRNRLQGLGLQVVDATCPLVRHVHRSLARLVAEGYFPVIIGKRGHSEVVGLIGDLAECALVESEADLPRLAGHPRLGVVSQTTQPERRVHELVEAIRSAYPAAEVRHIDTVCQPTKDRQRAAVRLARECDVIVVVGGERSNNTRHLVATCASEGAAVFRVERAEELRPSWFVGARCVGLTAGTSTPDDVVEEVHRALVRFSGTEMRLAA